LATSYRLSAIGWLCACTYFAKGVPPTCRVRECQSSPPKKNYSASSGAGANHLYAGIVFMLRQHPNITISPHHNIANSSQNAHKRAVFFVLKQQTALIKNFSSVL
jgi:hypothetical protein